MMPLEVLLGATLTTSDGGTIDTATLANKKTICLYFSAHWCGPCRGFTPKLAAAWAEYKKQRATMPMRSCFLSRGTNQRTASRSTTRK